MAKEFDNAHTRDNGGDRIDDPSGSIRSAGSGSADGSAGRIDGSGGNTDGNAGRIDGAGTGNDIGGLFGTSSAEPDTIDIGNVRDNVSGSENDPRSRSERERTRRTIRLGQPARNRDTDSGNDDSGTGTGNEAELDNEPSIRLGARGRNRPKSKVDTDSAPTDKIKLSDTRELVSVFLSSIFEIPATALRQDFWRLDKDENKALTDSIIAYLESMPKARSSKIALFIQENLPILNLVMIALFIVGSKAQMSIAIAKVTKAGRAVDIGSETRSTNGRAEVRTPMDSMFNN
jgi:hypothetical protein